MAISVALIYMALVLQFRNAAAVRLRGHPARYGGSLRGLAIMGQPFGFMAFLGVASLVGVIVSHVIGCSTSSKKRTSAASRCVKRCWMPGSCGCGR